MMFRPAIFFASAGENDYKILLKKYKLDAFLQASVELQFPPLTDLRRVHIRPVVLEAESF
jgi:hypothetical protein